MAQIEKFIESAWLHLRADRPKQAMDSAKKAHAIQPESPEVWHLLGILASRDGQPAIALPLLQKAIDTGGKTPERLRHIAEALLDAGYPEAALVPLNDAINIFGETSELMGLKSATYIALEDWQNAINTAQIAISLNPGLMAWELNLAFAQMMLGNVQNGFKNLSARPENLKMGSVCPTLMFCKPTTIWLKGEQSVGDIFYLRYVPLLLKKGWKFHLEVDRKLVPILQSSQFFLSVKEKNNCPNNQISIKVGDLALVALQCGITEIPPPLPLVPDQKLVEKYQHELAKIGPAPYIAVTWRGGPKGRKHRAGIRALEKMIDPKALGENLAHLPGTLVCLQRLPEPDEILAFQQGLGKNPADFSALNNNLSGMLALLSLVDSYISVPNTNVHLREGLAKPSHVFINRPFQDWRWQAEGSQSVWYPNSTVYRQEKNKSWQPALKQSSRLLAESLKCLNISGEYPALPNLIEHSTQTSVELTDEALLINEGWAVVAQNIPEAIVKAQLVLKNSPDNARAMHLLGWAAVQDLKFELGLSVLAKATQIEPNNGNIWRDYIRVHVLLNRCSEAINIGLDCLNNPNIWAKGVVHFSVGVAYQTIGNYLEALKHYDCCTALIPEHTDAPSAAGLIRLSLGHGYIRDGFKLHTARQEGRESRLLPYFICPTLKGDVSGLKILIVRTMGIGDELTYLRYLPYLVNAGADVTYWCGEKLGPLLSRLPYPLNIIPSTEPIPDPSKYDLAFIKNELPVAVNHLGAPEIADSLPLMTDPQKLEKWREWLNAHGEGPYIGITWQAGVGGNIKDAFGFTRLSKKIDPQRFAQSIKGVRATWVSLTRNITKEMLFQFEQYLGCSVIDLAGLTDDLEDLLCIQQLLDENIGVSNTNMHLRDCLGLGSRVLVSDPSPDWRWGISGNTSPWFKKSKIYREHPENHWEAPLNALRNDLIERYGLQQGDREQFVTAPTVSSSLSVHGADNNKVIWVTAGEIQKGESGYFSQLASAQERVINVAKMLETRGWKSVYLNESVSELMGGWHDKAPVKGDIVVFSKVFTDHAITLMQDAKARGATVILDVFNDFESQPKRAQQQRKMMDTADLVVSSPKLKLKWQRWNQPVAFYFEDINDKLPQERHDVILRDWLAILENPKNPTSTSAAAIFKHNEPTNNIKVSTQRLIWITGGDIKNIDGRLTSDLASTRYRVISPLKALEKHGWQSEIVIESVSQKEGDWCIAAPDTGDTVIVSKVFTEHSLSLVHDAKVRGARVILDLCDNHLGDPKRGPLQKALLDIADKVVTSTQALNEALATVGKKADAVISDPVEFKRGEIKFAPSKVLNLVWFGHAGNLDALAHSLPALAELSSDLPLNLKVVTTLPNAQQDLNQIVPDSLKATYIAWSVDATQAAIEASDIVIIPTLQSDFKNAKSPNRLLESLWAGRMVVAGAIPAYLHFADSAWIGNNLVDGIRWCLDNPIKVKERVRQGQEDIQRLFTQDAIARQWHQHLSNRNVFLSFENTQKLENVVVVISYFNERDVTDLIELIESINTYAPGLAIEIAIVVNDVTNQKLPSLNTKHPTHIFYRENVGMNIGAWEFGWRQFPNHDAFIFLQDECRIIKKDWAKQIIDILNDSKVGLVGESFNDRWNIQWCEIIKDQKLGERAKQYLHLLNHWRISEGLSAGHLRSLILGASKDTLNQINGFQIGHTLDECIASEIGISKKVEAVGRIVRQINQDQPFYCIAHTEWSHLGFKQKDLEFDTDFEYGQTFTLKSKHYSVKPRTDLFELIDNYPRRICEIGCADGTNLFELAKLLELDLSPSNFVGVDIGAIHQYPAYQNFEFHHQTAERFLSLYNGEKFDLVILSDVVEHLYNPWKFMRLLSRHLNKGARVLISVPNIQNLNYVNATITGNFQYTRTGLMDVTHIRFFSVETIINLVESAGFKVIKQSFRQDNSLNNLKAIAQESLTNQSNSLLNFGNFKINATKHNIDRLFAQQILLSCTSV